MSNTEAFVGRPQSRVDGPLKVSGTATYVAEFGAEDLLHAVVVSGAIAKGRITSIDTAAALKVPGVIEIFTHENRPRTAWFDYKYRDEVAPPGSPLRPLYDASISYSGQPVALVVAETLQVAQYAASLVEVSYEAEPAVVDVAEVLGEAYVPKQKRSGISPPPKPRGDADGAFLAAPIRLEHEYRVAVEHHNPMEMHATTVVWEGDGKLTVHDKIQGAQNSHGYITSVFGLSADDVRVHSPYIGGAFGSGLRPQYQLFLAVMASLQLERSVKLVLTRDQMFTFSYRPDAIQRVALAADKTGRLQAVRHEAVMGTSRHEDYQEVVVNWSGLLYSCDNVRLDYKLAQIDTHTPADMRAPGATLGVYALESAMDELAYAAGIDPIELRLINFADKDENENKPFSSKELRACYAQGADRIGWSRRNPVPRSMHEGRELVGLGMATGCWEAQMQKTSARAVLTANGHLEVSSATADIGTGTYTIMTQIAADALGLPLESVTAVIGDSSLPTAPVEGGSWAAASTGTAVRAACHALRQTLLDAAAGIDGSPLAGATLDQVTFQNGRIAFIADPVMSVSIGEAMQATGKERIEAEETASPDMKAMATYSSYTHSAIFAEVRVDEELGIVRVTRIVNAVAAGKILNPKTARSQILGGVVMGIGMALHEESIPDKNLGRFMNHNFAEYHVPAHADVEDIDVIFVEEEDDMLNPLGIKGLGEIGIVGTAAAIANAIHHATGRRVRHLPITLDKLL
ncbi:xanthine dehydrogenase family protein molybdopterin-binding subunit [Mangrovicella endophytica]|uniref:xanthine dehydrogenase family protein molybdopterin-binding subunit n=1 Tax=Mangrovicella endophytica TaxID=2066697 RepID=UPI000C9E0F03|nr:xanthine dehydrogenase family protein molybdopterin-binding subunit [Mangrovicella endophytica]